MNKSATGTIGEDIATQYLKGLGWKIIERNFRKPWGEIDIVALDRDRTLVFVEVKTMKNPGALTPEDNMTRAKYQKVSRTAALYAASSPLVKENRGWRIDLVAIDLDEKPRDENNIRHYRNVLL